ncbi:N-acetylmuramoyl-L-alanine amidase [Pedobacter nutrimenti]|jgi:N-acetylmuramoyl-L-alanine amidase|uniref:N-acetylmuramoyl-L-alanine amidase n=1 Tax=Pedobacter nutrimenti TaxID=1241337 RepID=A0A318UEI0_9SPHI|nr:N-acetylmuramoyl-L-alanine amidase [Pedobacter nutrimenti]PYF74814.1 N-acetylmuramoyl-L-alanine amidase [Pedobacter nutrimenti]
MEFITYLLKVSTCLLVFYGSYMIFLKNLSFFKANRVYLLATLSLSFIIPLLKFERSPDLAVVPFFNGYIPAEQITSRALAPISLNNEVNTLSLSGLVFCLYLLVAVLLLWRGLSKIRQITKFIDTDFVRVNGLKVIYKKSGFVNCSFFNYVFIDKTGLTPENIQILLKHEEVHARQLHSLDKLIMVVCKALLWFNPIIYWYEMALEEVNEFEADAVTANVYSAGPYAGLLIELATKTQLNPVLHYFSRYSLKGRITMLCRTASGANLKWSYLSVVPLLICLSWLFAFKVPDVSMKRETGSSDFIVLLDAGHGGKDNGVMAGGFLEKDLTLALLQKVNAIAKERKLKVINTRNTDHYLSLKDRVNTQGDLLLSLHVNQDVDAKVNGIQLVLGNAGGDKTKAEKLKHISYQFYKNLQGLSGIGINNVPKEVKGLYILDKSKVPALILELGYLTHREDRHYLTDPSKQQELATAIVNSILDYRKTLK